MPAGESPFHLTPATIADWPWILDALGQVAWEGLNPRERQVTRPETARRLAGEVVARIESQRVPHYALVARAGDGHPAGFVWVGEYHNDRTGQPEAWVLGLYVEPSDRGQGVGRYLMAAAERWAGQRGLEYISLSVDAPNKAAQRLYEALGYQVERLRMAKGIDGRSRKG